MSHFPFFFLFHHILNINNKMASRAFATAIRSAARTTLSRPAVAIRPMSMLANNAKRAAVKSTAVSIFLFLGS